MKCLSVQTRLGSKSLLQNDHSKMSGTQANMRNLKGQRSRYIKLFLLHWSFFRPRTIRKQKWFCIFANRKSPWKDLHLGGRNCLGTAPWDKPWNYQEVWAVDTCAPVFSKCALISELLLRTICFRMKGTKIPNSLVEKSLSIWDLLISLVWWKN